MVCQVLTEYEAKDDRMRAYQRFVLFFDKTYGKVVRVDNWASDDN